MRTLGPAWLFTHSSTSSCFVALAATLLPSELTLPDTKRLNALTAMRRCAKDVLRPGH